MIRKLHIGGKIPANGWEILNVLPGEHVDHLGNANDLSQFEDGTFDEIYASHILEHLDYKKELGDALIEWHRVIKPGGTLKVSVPNLEMLCKLFLHTDGLDSSERFKVMQMMFGGHVDEYDYHVVGLDFVFLSEYFHMAGFEVSRRVNNFGLFPDASEMFFKGYPISLNMEARKALQ